MMEVGKSDLLLRAVVLAVAGAGTLFWLYTFYGIAQVPLGDGSGMQWVAVMPLGLIFAVFTLPALVCAWKVTFYGSDSPSAALASLRSRSCGTNCSANSAESSSQYLKGLGLNFPPARQRDVRNRMLAATQAINDRSRILGHVRSSYKLRH